MTTPNYYVRDGYPLADCEEAWRKHGEWSLYYWALFLGLLPYFFIIGSLFDKAAGPWHLPQWVFVYSAGCYVAPFIAVSIVQRRFRCPRCGASTPSLPWVHFRSANSVRRENASTAALRNSNVREDAICTPNKPVS